MSGEVSPKDLEIAELAIAQRDRAVDVIDKLERMITRIGGHTSQPDQEAIREARALLEIYGKRTVKRVEWTDRVVLRKHPGPIRGVDVPCENCGAQRGSEVDRRGFNRCNACGYPGQ